MDNLTHPTKQERATARTLADDTTLAWGSGPDEYQELADRIAYALADARVQAAQAEKKRTDDMQQCLDVVIEALPQDRLRALIESLDDDLT